MHHAPRKLVIFTCAEDFASSHKQVLHSMPGNLSPYHTHNRPRVPVYSRGTPSRLLSKCLHLAALITQAPNRARSHARSLRSAQQAQAFPCTCTGVSSSSLVWSLGGRCRGGPDPVAERACQSRSSESGRFTGRRCIITMMPWNVSPDTVTHSASAPCAPRCAAAGAQCQRRVTARDLPSRDCAVASAALSQHASRLCRSRAGRFVFLDTSQRVACWDHLQGLAAMQLLSVRQWAVRQWAVQATSADLAGKRRRRLLRTEQCGEHQRRRCGVQGTHLVVAAEDERASGVCLLGDG